MGQVFEQSSIAGIELQNRIIRSATYEGLGDEEGRPTKELADLYSKLAQGGVGAIITGLVVVQTDGRALKNMCMLDRDDYIEDYRKLLSPLKIYRTPVIMQLVHCGGKSSSSVTGENAAAPSEMKYPLSQVPARELSDQEIKKIIDSFIKSIGRAKEAGFDGVQLHAAHGYLLSQFLSPYMNRREDIWGGSKENRFRIIAEIIRGARQKFGSYPLLMKFSAYDSDENGMTVEEAVKVVKMFQEVGGDCVEVSCGGITGGSVPENRFNYNVPAAMEIKRQVHIPVIVVGGIRKIEDMEKIIQEKKADYIAISRPLINDTGLVNKLKERSLVESKCINCSNCLFRIKDNPVKCYYKNR